MSRPRGGFIGYNPAPAASAFNSSAGGIWTLREAEALKRAGTWPTAFSSPTSLPGLQLWLDASDSSTLYDATSGGSLVAADGGVARWEDKSGNARHATQSTSGSRPVRKTAIQGGLDVLRFDGSDDWFVFSSSTSTFKFLHSTDSTVFVALTRSSTDDASIVDNVGGSTAGTGFTMYFANGSASSDKITAFAGRGVSQQTTFINTSGNDFVPSGWSVVSHVGQPLDATAAERSALRRNGGATQSNNSSTNAASTSNASNDLRIGSFHNLNTSYTFGGDIAEIIIYNSALSDTDREAVENYLMTKWGIS